MSIYVAEQEERLVATVGADVIEWFDRERAALGAANPFQLFDPYGVVRLDPEAGDVAAFASALRRSLGALERADIGEVAGLPVLADEHDPEGDELDAAGLVDLLRAILDRTEEAESRNLVVLGRGD